MVNVEIMYEETQEHKDRMASLKATAAPLPVARDVAKELDDLKALLIARGIL